MASADDSNMSAAAFVASVGAYLVAFIHLNEEMENEYAEGGVGWGNGLIRTPCVNRDTASSKYNPDIAEMKDHIKVMATAFAASQAIAFEAHGDVKAARGGMWPVLNSMVSLSRKERMTAARLFHREPLLLSGFMETPDADKLEYLRYLIGADEDEP